MKSKKYFSHETTSNSICLIERNSIVFFRSYIFVLIVVDSIESIKYKLLNSNRASADDDDDSHNNIVYVQIWLSEWHQIRRV